MTNREQIEKMPDEVLIKLLNLDSRCPPDLESAPCPDYMDCKDCWFKWLKSETLS